MDIVKECLGKVAVTVEKDYWKINKAYDRLVIVELKNQFKTFISRKPVPAGTFITDREYWIPFSSLTEEITTQYTAMLSKTEALETWYNNMDNRVQQVNNTIQIINNSVTDIRAAIRAIDEYLRTISSTVGGESNMTFDPILNIPKWLDNSDKWVDAMGIDITTYKFAESINLTPNYLPVNREYGVPYYVGYTVLVETGFARVSETTGDFELETITDASSVPLYVVESDMGIYQYVNSTGWTKVGDFV